MPQRTHRPRMTAAVLLVISYALIVISVTSIGLIVEHNSTQTQERVCEALRLDIITSASLAVYIRSVSEGVPVKDLAPTADGQRLVNDLNARYGEVCNGAAITQ